MENNKTREGKIYLNNKTGNLHLVIKDNITDKFLGNGTNYIVLREMSNLKKQLYIIIDFDSFYENYSFFMTFNECKNMVGNTANELLNDSSIVEGLELKRKNLNEREKILKEKITNIMNTIQEWSIELDELFPEYTYEN